MAIVKWTTAKKDVLPKVMTQCSVVAHSKIITRKGCERQRYYSKIFVIISKDPMSTLGVGDLVCVCVTLLVRIKCWEEPVCTAGKKQHLVFAE